MDLVRSLILRGLGVIYGIAFLSVAVQVEGLYGQQGITPIGDTLTQVGEGLGIEKIFRIPTLFWLSSSDAFLRVVCFGGVAASAFLILGFFPTPLLALLWFGYLSLNCVGWPFFPFQWDLLLLEIGFLAIFLSPLTTLPTRWGRTPCPREFTWLLRWLLFRLYFSSGWVKLREDEVWRDGTALDFHYETQPLPSWTAWYAHQFSPQWDRLCVYGTLAVELAIPFLVLLPAVPRSRPFRIFGFVSLTLLQLAILATGNYTFFNLLALLLGFVLLDDATLRTSASLVQKRLPRLFFPSRLLPARQEVPTSVPPRDRPWPGWVSVPIAALVFLLTLPPTLRTLGFGPLPSPVRSVEAALTPYFLANSYGLFADMTERRLEIVLESSPDGEAWHPIEFRFKPGGLSRRPQFVTPHQPRLDWQMWFAALSEPYSPDNGWFFRLCHRLLQGAPAVTSLLGENPWLDPPPRYLRADRWEYRFTSPEERRETGNWWKRTRLGTYLRPVTLDEHGRLIPAGA